MNLKSTEYIEYGVGSKVHGQYTINGPCFVYIKSRTNLLYLKTYDGVSLDNKQLVAGDNFFVKNSVYLETWNNSGTSGFCAFVAYFE